jgi:hypothetical protein
MGNSQEACVCWNVPKFVCEPPERDCVIVCLECKSRCKASTSRVKLPGSFNSSLGPIMRLREYGRTVHVEEVV